MEDPSETYEEYREWFKINQKTGNITLKKDISQNIHKKFNFTVIASDSAELPKTTTSQVIIIINTMIINTAGKLDPSKIASMVPMVGYPILEKYNHYAVLNDASPAGSIVATIKTYKSLDNDNFIFEFVENKKQVSLNCLNQTQNNMDENEQNLKIEELFQISPTSGVISTKNSLKNLLTNDVERFKMWVVVTSSTYTSISLRAEVVVDVVAFVNPYPVFAKIFTGSVIENSLKGAYVLTIRTSRDEENKRRNSRNQLECSDIDPLPPSWTKYFLLENPQNAFSIEQNTGVLTLAKNIGEVKEGKKELEEYILKVAARKSGFNAETYVSVDVVKSRIGEYRFEECKITHYESFNKNFGSNIHEKEGSKGVMADGYVAEKDALIRPLNLQKIVSNHLMFMLNLSTLYIEKSNEIIYIGSLKKEINCLKYRMVPKHKFMGCPSGLDDDVTDNDDMVSESVIEVLYNMISVDQLNGDVVLNVKEEQKSFVLGILHSTIKPSESLTLYFTSWCVPQCSQVNEVEINIINKEIKMIQFLKSNFEFFVSFDAQAGTEIGEITMIVHPYSHELARGISYKKTSPTFDNFILINNKIILSNTISLKPVNILNIQAVYIDQFNSVETTCTVHIYVSTLQPSCYSDVYFINEGYNLVVDELPASNQLLSVKVAVNTSCTMQKVFKDSFKQYIEYYIFETNKTTGRNNDSIFNSGDDILEIGKDSGIVTVVNLEKFVKQKRLSFLVTTAFEPSLKLFLINATSPQENNENNQEIQTTYSPLYNYATTELNIETKLNKPVLIFTQNKYYLNLNHSSEVNLAVKAYVYDEDGDGVKAVYEYYFVNETRFTNDGDEINMNGDNNLFIIDKLTGLVTRNKEVDFTTFENLYSVSYVISAIATYRNQILKAETKLNVKFQTEETTPQPTLRPTIPLLTSPTLTTSINEVTTGVVGDVKATDWRPYVGIGVLLLVVLLIIISICAFCCYKGYYKKFFKKNKDKKKKRKKRKRRKNDEDTSGTSTGENMSMSNMPNRPDVVVIGKRRRRRVSWSDDEDENRGAQGPENNLEHRTSFINNSYLADDSVLNLNDNNNNNNQNNNVNNSNNKLDNEAVGLAKPALMVASLKPQKNVDRTLLLQQLQQQQNDANINSVDSLNAPQQPTKPSFSSYITAQNQKKNPDYVNTTQPPNNINNVNNSKDYVNTNISNEAIGNSSEFVFKNDNKVNNYKNFPSKQHKPRSKSTDPYINRDYYNDKIFKNNNYYNINNNPKGLTLEEIAKLNNRPQSVDLFNNKNNKQQLYLQYIYNYYQQQMKQQQFLKEPNPPQQYFSLETPQETTQQDLPKHHYEKIRSLKHKQQNNNDESDTSSSSSSSSSSYDDRRHDDRTDAFTCSEVDERPSSSRGVSSKKHLQPGHPPSVNLPPGHSQPGHMGGSGREVGGKEVPQQWKQLHPGIKAPPMFDDFDEQEEDRYLSHMTGDVSGSEKNVSKNEEVDKKKSKTKNTERFVIKTPSKQARKPAPESTNKDTSNETRVANQLGSSAISLKNHISSSSWLSLEPPNYDPSINHHKNKKKNNKKDKKHNQNWHI